MLGVNATTNPKMMNTPPTAKAVVKASSADHFPSIVVIHEGISPSKFHYEGLAI
jgi:hypothetical protein